MTRSRFHHHMATSALTAAVCLLAGLPVDTRADVAAEGTVDLLTTPPELTASVAPNVVLTFDDSGSMNWHHMPDSRPYVSGRGWNTASDGDQSAAANRTYRSLAAPYLCAGVIDPTVTDINDARSWAMNGAYYNANATYLPPLGVDGVTAFPAARFTAAWRNGIAHNRPDAPASSATDNLGTKSFCGNAGAGYYRYAGPALTLNAMGAITNTGDLYTNASWVWVTLPVEKRQNFANWYAYYRTRNMAAISSVSRAYAAFNNSIRVAWQNINSNHLVPGTTEIFPFEDNAAVDNTRTRFYEWLFKNPAAGNTPNQTAADRAGQLFMEAKKESDTNPYWDRGLKRELSCRKNFHIQMTDGMWNNSTVDTATDDTTAVAPLPDGRTYSVADLQSKIYWNEEGVDQNKMADIAFHYWSTDLRPDFIDNEQTKLKVRPYLPDRSTSLWGPALGPGDDALDNKEIYWNPANDPATWPHLVQFMIGFGVSGTIPKIDANYARLRAGAIAWPALSGSDPYDDEAEKIDDMWHAAINSRGKFFAASNPNELITALQNIIASVIAQSTSSTPVSLSLPILTGGNSGYAAGYDSADWAGSLKRHSMDANTAESTGVLWDAGCILTGDACVEPPGTSTARDPGSRVIVTSNGLGTGNAFRWSSLTTAQQAGLDPDADTFGEQRLDYVRGVRIHESTDLPRLRKRSSVLGAVINGQPTYVSTPRGGFTDIFPADSPEATGESYARYQNDQRSRTPMVYVGSNDGLMHAFDAATGVERWAYVPNLLIENGRLARSTAVDAGLVPGVDMGPREADVFIDGKWKTILVGTLRLGGRGIYALDVTDPLVTTETAAASELPMWEFTSGAAASSDADGECAAGASTCASLGYTYDSINVARLHYANSATNNSWFALVSSGYFPQSEAVAADADDNNEAAAKRTSLLVIDVQSGKLIRELRTSEAPQIAGVAGFKTFGLSTPVVDDLGADDVDDIVYAGDLAGNLWRFDLGSDDPAEWSVDLMFTTYGNGGADVAGDQPIVFNPTNMRDTATGRAMVVFGTGKYLGEEDRTNLIPQQAFYGIRDYGKGYPFYPIKVDQLITQVMVQNTATNVRSIEEYESPTGTVPDGVKPIDLGRGGDGVSRSVRAQGWRLPLNIESEPGERAQRRAIPLFSPNFVVLYSLIPKSDDPCDPGARYGIMVLDAKNGGVAGVFAAGGAVENNIVGETVGLPSPPGDPTMPRGGGALIIPGVSEDLSDEVKEVLNSSVPVWHRSAWRELLDLQ